MRREVARLSAQSSASSSTITTSTNSTAPAGGRLPLVLPEAGIGPVARVAPLGRGADPVVVVALGHGRNVPAPDVRFPTSARHERKFCLRRGVRSAPAGEYGRTHRPQRARRGAGALCSGRDVDPRRRRPEGGWQPHEETRPSLRRRSAVRAAGARPVRRATRGPPLESQFEKVTLNDRPGEPIATRGVARPARAAHRPHGRGPHLRPAHAAQHARGRRSTSTSTTRRASRASQSTPTSTRTTGSTSTTRRTTIPTPVDDPLTPARQRGRRALRPGTHGGLRRSSRAPLRLSRFKLDGRRARPRLASRRSSTCRSTAASAATSAARSTSTRRATCTCRRVTTPTRSSRRATCRSTSAPTATRPSTPSARRPTPTTCAASCCASARARTAATTSRAATCSRAARRRPKPEIYAMGLRNPFRFAVNREDRRRLRRRLLAGRRPAGPRTAGPAGHGRWMIVDKPAQLRLALLRHAGSRLPRLGLRHREGRRVRSTARVRSTTRRTTPASAVLPPVAAAGGLVLVPGRRRGPVPGAPRRTPWAAPASGRWAARRTSSRRRNPSRLQVAARTTTGSRSSTSGPATTSRSSGSTSRTASACRTSGRSRSRSATRGSTRRARRPTTRVDNADGPGVRSGRRRSTCSSTATASSPRTRTRS